MSDIYKEIGRRIRELRKSFGGKGISQAALGKATHTSPNTISRWETGTYKLSISDLESIAHLFGVPIARMFPVAELSSQMNALLSAAEGLKEADIQELTRYALFKRATTLSNGPEKHSKS